MIKLLICFVFITVAQAGNNVLLIIADDFGTDSQSLDNAHQVIQAGTKAASGQPFRASFTIRLASRIRVHQAFALVIDHRAKLDSSCFQSSAELTDQNGFSRT
jgi:hypothetical protein